MRWNGILSVGLLLLSCLAARAEDGAESTPLKNENEQLRRERDALEFRLRILQEQLDEVRRKLPDELKLTRGEQPRGKFFPEIPTPPVAVKPKAVRGKITALSADLRLMQVSVGQDAGVKEGQVLDVFRLTTEKGKIVPLYLGTLRLTRVDPQTALGNYERVPGLDRMPKVGDEVANELTVK